MLKNVEKKLPRNSVQDIIDLTPLQEGLLFHYLMASDGAHYHEQLRLDLAGSIDRQLFQQAWEHVVHSNEMLRTVFRWQGLKKPVQIVLKQSEVNIQYVDLSHIVSSEEQRLCVAAIQQADLSQHFNLQEVPFRIILCKLTAEQFITILSNHHILYDGWSNGIILSEFFGNYQRLQTHRQLPQSTQKTPFKAYVKWLQAQDQKKQARFWQSYLKDFHTQTHLPIKNKYASAAMTPIAYNVSGSAELKQRLDDFCRKNLVTLASVLYSAFGIVLQKYNNTDDVIFGTTVSGRNADLEDILWMVGLFINTLPLRVQGSNQQSVLDVIQRVNADLLARMDFEGTPLVDIKDYSELNTHDDLFDTILVIENYPLDQQLLAQKDNLAINAFSSAEMTNYDLTIVVSLVLNSIDIAFNYKRELFDETTITRLADCLMQTLEVIVNNPSARLCDIEMISAAEKEIILQQFNATTTDYPSDKTIHALFMEQAEKYPHRVALYCGHETMTYHQLHTKSNHLAAYLQSRGVQEETVVGICAERSLDLMVGIFAILQAGGTYLPLDPRQPLERIDYILADSGTHIVLCQHKFVEMLNTHCPVLDLEDAALYTSTLASKLSLTSNARNLAYILYTSGSTGRPKGVAIEHRSVVNRLYWVQQRYRLNKQDVVLQKTNIMFDVSVWEFFGWFFGGAALCLLEPGAEANPHAIVATIAQFQITFIHFVPSMLQMFLDYLQQHHVARQLHSLRTVWASGEALHVNQVAQFYALLPSQPNLQLVNLYGPTEATVDVSYYECAKTDGSRECIPIGRPIDNARLYVLNDDYKLQPIGVPGELYIAGVGVARGYINNPELTSERFMQDVFYPTERMYKSGDRVRWLSTGELEYLGRLDHQVKIRGFRVELAEVEANLVQSPAIKEAVVVVVKDRAGDDRMIAYAVPHVKNGINIREVKTFLANKLPAYMLPDTIVELERLPLTMSGKVDRNKLPSPVAKQWEAQAMPEMELTSIERTVAEIWADVLGVEHISLDDVFFEIGGNSLKIMRVCSQLMTALHVDVPVTVLFRFPSVRLLARHIAEEYLGQPVVSQDMPPAHLNASPTAAAKGDVAVIGMSGRFPGASTLDAFWDNLQNGVESIRKLSEEELLAEGVALATLNDPHYVRAKGVLDAVEYFDAAFFGYSPKEAESMDPQLRLLHECVWEALENAGYNPERYDGEIGLYAGSSANFHWLQKIVQHATSHLDEFSLMLLNEKDFLSSRIAYKMNFRGPSITLQTACSTSLTAIHHAYNELLDGNCTMAVAAGVSVTYPLHAGYLYQDGMIFSPDGHCRAFDEKAQGTVGGNGVGVVVLKRLEDALRDGDYIHAVIKGSAVTNDGFNKVGFTAPGVDGQAHAIAAAHARANVEAETITYVETHGTGTALGDPIEVEALKMAFNTDKAQFCALGSVKTNIGHLDAAAGIAGFIKTVLALKHAQLPASLHFERPNPNIGLDKSPFYVVSSLSAWKRGKTPLRAGVSSFGMGGTNAHVVLEEPPKVAIEAEPTGWHIIPLSAKSETSLQRAVAKLKTYMQSHQELNLADIAYTMQVGRKPFAHRRFIVCSRTRDAIQAFDESENVGEGEQLHARIGASHSKDFEHAIVFMFPGQGTQYVNMGADLYQSEHTFRNEVDHCCEIVQRLCGVDMRAILYPTSDDSSTADQINQTEYTQPLLFIYEYALARLLMGWGIKPKAMLGHSLGEYVAACLAGLFSLEDALKLVTIRARLMQQLPAGSMVSVSLAEDELRPLLSRNLSIAAKNSNSLCVVSGPTEEVDEFAHTLKKRGYDCRSLITSHAFHSKMMEPMLDDFYRTVAQVTFNQPRIPFISNVSGTWVQNDEVTNPEYWVKHLRETVRFSEGIEHLLSGGAHIFVEVGPGRTLTELVRKNVPKDTLAVTVNMGRHPLENVADTRYLLQQLGALWSCGVEIDWHALHAGQERHRVPLPSYAFDAQRFWPDESMHTSTDSLPVSSLPKKQRDMADWFYTPSWERSLVSHDHVGELHYSSWLLFVNKDSICEALIQALKDQQANITIVYVGEHFEQISTSEYVIHPQRVEDFRTLLQQVSKVQGMATAIVHMWNLTDDASLAEMPASLLATGFYALTNLAKALGEIQLQDRVHIFTVANGIEQVTGLEQLYPLKATIYGFSKICPLEYPNIACRAIDIEVSVSQRQEPDEIVAHLLEEFSVRSSEGIVAYRGGYRWTKTIKPVRLEAPSVSKSRLRTGGVYLITGGLGGVGFAIASFLAEAVKPTLILVGRRPFPERATWQDWLAQHEREDKTSRTILAILNMETLGARVVVFSADIADETQMGSLIRTIEQEYGLINGVVHAAGIADYAGIIQMRLYEANAAIIAPKVQGTILLDRLLNQRELDFFVLCSSIGNIIYQQKIGQSGYNAANEFLDAYAHFRRTQGKTFWVSINWTDWQEVGMALDSATYWADKLALPVEEMLADAVTNAEGIEVFQRILGCRNSQVIVSPQELSKRIDKAQERLEIVLKAPQKPITNEEAPKSLTQSDKDFERELSQIWKQHLGFESIEIHTKFFDLGAGSLDLLQVNAMIKDRFHIDLPLVTLYEHPTIHALATFMRSELLPEPEVIVSSNTGDALKKTKSLLKNASTKMGKKPITPG